MKKLLTITVILLFFVMIIFPSSGIQIEQSYRTLLHRGNTLYVGGNGSGNYSKIQDAIDDASDGDTVFVYDDSSPYNEWDIHINKSINLIGEDRYSTVIDGNENGEIVNISADWVHLSGFKIQNSSYKYSGVKINSNFNTIKENRILNNNIGIFLNLNTSNNTLTGNYLTFNYKSILLSYSSNNNIESNNCIKNFGDCLYLKNSNNNNIVYNHFFDNSVHKNIVLIDSYGNNIIGNSISPPLYNDDIGIYLSDSNNNIINDNTVTCNDKEGIYLSSSDNNTIINNAINTEDSDGLYLSCSSNNTLVGNTIYSKNGDGANLLSSNNSIISDNSFLKCGLRVDNSYQKNVFNNTVNGKPLVYLEDKSDIVVDVNAGEIILVNCDNITIKNQELYNTSIGIELLDTINTYIYDYRFFNCKIGILLLSSNNNVITSSKILNSLYSIYLCYSNNNNIIGNNISSGMDSRGIKIINSNNNSIIENNIIAYMYGIYLGSSNYNVISNNTINVTGTIFGECDIWVDESTNNIISGNTLSSKAANGIFIQYLSDNNLIFRNNIDSCGGHGVYINGNVGGKGCKNNVIYENIISHNNANGVKIYWGCNNNVVKDNTIFSNGNNGILVSKNSKNTEITGNIIISNNKNGILIDEDSNNISVSRNFICYNGESGVFITKEFKYVYWNADYVTISENNISFNEKWGVHLDGDYHKVFSNNFIQNGDNAYFIKRRPFYPSDSWCKWSDNYWDDLDGSKFKLIKGKILLFCGLFRDYFFFWFQFDWHPAKEPYDI